MVVLNINDQTETEAGNAGAVFDLSGAQARKEIVAVRDESTGSVRITPGALHWNLVAQAVMTDCRTKLCTTKWSKTEAQIKMSSLIQIAISSAVKIMHLL